MTVEVTSLDVSRSCDARAVSLRSIHQATIASRPRPEFHFVNKRLVANQKHLIHLLMSVAPRDHNHVDFYILALPVTVVSLSDF